MDAFMCEAIRDPKGKAFFAYLVLLSEDATTNVNVTLPPSEGLGLRTLPTEYQYNIYI
jgi:hypothetical protein